jgi:hypothetical protein
VNLRAEVNQTAETADDELRWRIPTAGDPGYLRLGMAQIGLATVVAALIVLFTAPAAWRGPALAGLLPLAIFVAYRRWLRYQRSLAGDDNVRLDSGGLFWRDPAGTERGFARASVTGFRIGREPDTLRPVEALTLYLAQGFESQPIELHPPASASAVRQMLACAWQLDEREHAAGQKPAPYDVALDVYSECHDDFQEWHFEGTRAALAELFEAIAAAAAELPAPPPGAKPLARVLLCRRREQSRLTVSHDVVPQVTPDTIAAPAAALLDLARQGRAALASREKAEASAPADFKFDWQLAPHDRWTIHLHVR